VAVEIEIAGTTYTGAEIEPLVAARDAHLLDVSTALEGLDNYKNTENGLYEFDEDESIDTVVQKLAGDNEIVANMIREIITATNEGRAEEVE
jgi:hypothetical protein